MENYEIKSIALGEPKSYKISEKVFESAYKKDNFLTSVFVNKFGLEGDFQVDKRFHGGVDKAIHIGSFTHLEKNKEFDKLFIGCNLLVDKIDECEVYIGDIYKIGDVKLEVTQPRQPCWKIGALFGKDVNRYILKNHATGWYVRVLKEGMLDLKHPMILEKRVSNFTIKQLSSFLKMPPEDKNIIEDILNLDTLANSYKKDFLKVLGENNS